MCSSDLVFLFLSPLALASSALVFILIVVATRYVSLGSIVATIAFPVGVFLLSTFVRPVEGLEQILAASIIGGVLIIFMHRANIGRLTRGAENKFR